MFSSSRLISNANSTSPSLPEINARIEHKLGVVEHELSGFPEQSLAPSMEVHREADQFARHVETHIKGGCLQNGFRDGYKAIISKLWKNFRKARPQSTLVTPGFKSPAICLDSDDDEDTMRASATPTPNSSRSAKFSKANDGRAIATPTPIRTKGTPLKQTPLKPEDAAGTGPTVFTLTMLRQAYASGNNAGLPDGLSPEVTNVLSLQCLKNAPMIVNEGLDEIKHHMVNSLAGFLQVTLSPRQGTKLFDEISGIVETFFVELFDSEKRSIDQDVARELYYAMVSDSEGFRMKKEEKKTELVHARTLQRVNECFDVEDSKRTKQTSPEEAREESGRQEVGRPKHRCYRHAAGHGRCYGDHLGLLRRRVQPYPGQLAHEAGVRAAASRCSTT